MILHAIESGAGHPVVFLHGLFGNARNFGSFQRALSARFRVIALDMRNHGASPHGDGMRYPELAADVLETLASLNALPAAMIGHSMGGKAAMAAALSQPEAVTRLLVADIAPVVYQHGNATVVQALQSIRLEPGLTRQQADAALVDAVPDPGVRQFLLQNLRFGASPEWRIGLQQIATAIPDLEGWVPLERNYTGPALFVTGAQSDYVQTAHRSAIRALFPKARFVAVKNAGHWLHADNPAAFMAVLEAFLAS
jgi:pimeloyl-ACP methyl ester carboxylesterase